MAEHFNLPDHNQVHDMRVSVVRQVKGGAPAVSGEMSLGTAARCNSHDQKCLCHLVAGGDFVTMAWSLSLKLKSCAQDNGMQIKMGQKWKARVKN